MAPLAALLPAALPVPGLVSVTIVVYNGERDVVQVIDSALGQNYPACIPRWGCAARTEPQPRVLLPMQQR